MNDKFFKGNLEPGGVTLGLSQRERQRRKRPAVGSLQQRASASVGLLSRFSLQRHWARYVCIQRVFFSLRVFAKFMFHVQRQPSAQTFPHGRRHHQALRAAAADEPTAANSSSSSRESTAYSTWRKEQIKYTLMPQSSAAAPGSSNHPFHATICPFYNSEYPKKSLWNLLLEAVFLCMRFSSRFLALSLLLQLLQNPLLLLRPASARARFGKLKQCMQFCGIFVSLLQPFKSPHTSSPQLLPKIAKEDVPLARRRVSSRKL